MRRIGPLVATALPGLVIGDAHARHVRLLPDRIEIVGDDGSESWAWDALADLSLDVPSTRWPHPAVGDWVVPFVMSMLGGGSEVPEVRDLTLHLLTADGDARAYELSGHWAVGYTRRHVALTARLVDLLRHAPEARALLSNPDAMLSRVGRIAR